MTSKPGQKYRVGSRRAALAQRPDGDIDRAHAAIVVGDEDVGFDRAVTVGATGVAKEASRADADDKTTVRQLCEAKLTDRVDWRALDRLQVDICSGGVSN